MLRISLLLFVALAGLSACSTPNASRAGALLYGMNQYVNDIQYASSRPTNWPARQQTANEFKSVVTFTLGVSPEFYRLVDLDLRKREFMITLRDTNVGPERLAEMKDELVQIDDEIAALKPVIKTQLAAQSLHEQSEDINTIATLGLLGIALDGFSGKATNRGAESPSTKVGQYLVTDFGSFATVRAASGSNFRCAINGNPNYGAEVRCEPGK